MVRFRPFSTTPHGDGVIAAITIRSGIATRSKRGERPSVGAGQTTIPLPDQSDKVRTRSPIEKTYRLHTNIVGPRKFRVCAAIRMRGLPGLKLDRLSDIYVTTGLTADLNRAPAFEIRLNDTGLSPVQIPSVVDCHDRVRAGNYAVQGERAIQIALVSTEKIAVHLAKWPAKRIRAATNETELGKLPIVKPHAYSLEMICNCTVAFCPRDRGTV
jgi:hypothetical protein